MEELYKFALELILRDCEEEDYGRKKNIQMICELALKTGDEDESTRQS